MHTTGMLRCACPTTVNCSQSSEPYLSALQYLPIIHNLVCTYWGDCTYDPGSDLRLILYTDRGNNTHFLHNRDLPEAQAFEAPRCLAGPNPLVSSDSPGNSSANQLVLFDRLLTGWGPQCRSDPIHCQPW